MSGEEKCRDVGTCGIRVIIDAARDASQCTKCWDSLLSEVYQLRLINKPDAFQYLLNVIYIFRALDFREAFTLLGLRLVD